MGEILMCACRHCDEQFPCHFGHECSYKTLKAVNERLRKALSQISSRELHTIGQMQDFGREAQLIARKALEREP